MPGLWGLGGTLMPNSSAPVLTGTQHWLVPTKQPFLSHDQSTTSVQQAPPPPSPSPCIALHHHNGQAAANMATNRATCTTRWTVGPPKTRVSRPSPAATRPAARQMGPRW